MTPEQINALAVTTIGTKTGQAAVTALLTAGLLPVDVEERVTATSDIRVGTRRTVVWQDQTRYVAAWRNA